MENVSSERAVLSHFDSFLGKDFSLHSHWCETQNSFLQGHTEGRWKKLPFYFLTFSQSLQDQHHSAYSNPLRTVKAFRRNSLLFLNVGGFP